MNKNKVHFSLLGPKMVGKTSFALKLQNKSIDRIPCTISVDFHSLDFNDKLINFYDYTGDDKLLNLFFNQLESNIYIVMYNVNEKQSVEYCRKIIKRIENTFENKKIVIFGNKADYKTDNYMDLYTLYKINEFNKYTIYEISVKNNTTYQKYDSLTQCIYDRFISLKSLIQEIISE